MMAASDVPIALEAGDPRLISRVPWNGIGAAGVLLIIWQLTFIAVGSDIVSSPLATFRATWRMLFDAAFLPNLVATSLAFGAAFAAAAVVGLALGFLLGGNRLAGDLAEPVISSFYAIPKLALYPVILLMVGIGMPARVTFGALHGVVPIVLLTMNAVRQMRPVWVKTGHVMRLSRLAVVRHILLPAVIPEAFSGLRIGFSLTLLGTLLGEMFGAQSGLGFLLMNAIGLVHVQTIMCITLLVGAFSVLANAALLALDKRLHRVGG